MKLNVSERFSLLFICDNWAKKDLPDLIFNKVMAVFANDLGFDQDEIDRLKFNKNASDWSKAEDKLKEVRVGNGVKKIVQNGLQKLDKKGELNFLKHFSLCEKFGYEPRER